MKDHEYVDVGNSTRAEHAYLMFIEIFLGDDDELYEKFKSIRKSMDDFRYELRQRVNRDLE